MDYKVFKEKVKKEFLGHMPDAFAEHTLVMEIAYKVNRELDKIELLPPKGVEDKIRPVLYVQDVYDHYKECNDFDFALDKAALEMAAGYRKMPENVVETIMDGGRDCIVMMLINTEQNKQFLEDHPHREFHDLSIVYRVVVEKNIDGIQSALITHELAERLGLGEEELFHAAVENTRRLFPPTVRSMNEVMKEMFLNDGMPDELVSMLIEDIEPESMLYVISNEDKVNGAVSMLYEDELHKLAEQLGSDLYIMPSSIHEVLAVSSNGKDPYELSDMVVGVNMEQVDLAERLSNQVYHYDKELREIKLATDTPNKRLDSFMIGDMEMGAEKRSR